MWGGARGVKQAIALLGQKQPYALVGFGGYPSLPTIIAAALLRIPIMLHEQNAYLGRSNRLLVRVAPVLFTSHSIVQGVSKIFHITINKLLILMD